MVRLSNAFVAFVNILALFISFVVIAISFLFIFRADTECDEGFVQKSLFVLGVFLLVMSLFGLLGSCCRAQFLLWIYLFVLFVLIVASMCFTVFTIVVTNKGVGQAISGIGFKEFRVRDYSNWLREHVNNDQHNWNKFKGCLIKARFCSTALGGNSKETFADFKKRDLFPIQSGCCKPPMYCGFEFVNATTWRVPKTGAAVPDSDCGKWNNNQDSLCWECESCKAGVLMQIKKEWMLLAKINSLFIVFLILLYFVGCCAHRNNHHHYSKPYGYHMPYGYA